MSDQQRTLYSIEIYTATDDTNFVIGSNTNFDTSPKNGGFYVFVNKSPVPVSSYTILVHVPAVRWVVFRDNHLYETSIWFYGETNWQSNFNYPDPEIDDIVGVLLGANDPPLASNQFELISVSPTFYTGPPTPLITISNLDILTGKMNNNNDFVPGKIIEQEDATIQKNGSIYALENNSGAPINGIMVKFNIINDIMVSNCDAHSADHDERGLTYYNATWKWTIVRNQIKITSKTYSAVNSPGFNQNLADVTWVTFLPDYVINPNDLLVVEMPSACVGLNCDADWVGYCSDYDSDTYGKCIDAGNPCTTADASFTLLYVDPPTINSLTPIPFTPLNPPNPNTPNTTPNPPPPSSKNKGIAWKVVVLVIVLVFTLGFAYKALYKSSSLSWSSSRLIVIICLVFVVVDAVVIHLIKNYKNKPKK
jgi:hypothetical protein